MGLFYHPRKDTEQRGVEQRKFGNGGAIQRAQASAFWTRTWGSAVEAIPVTWQNCLLSLTRYH
jgi:hypothetical protein